MKHIHNKINIQIELQIGVMLVFKKRIIIVTSKLALIGLLHSTHYPLTWDSNR